MARQRAESESVAWPSTKVGPSGVANHVIRLSVSICKRDTDDTGVQNPRAPK